MVTGVSLGGMTPSDTFDYHMYEAERHFKERSFGAALDEIAEAVRLDPFVGDAYFLRALILADLGDVAARDEGQSHRPHAVARDAQQLSNKPALS